MRIRSLYIDGYGIYRDMHLDEAVFSRPVTIVYGTNEAGKSTLHAFLLGMLFGFGGSKRPGLDALNGGRPGGVLTVENSSQQILRVERYAPPKRGKLRLFTADGGEQTSEAWLRELGHITLPVYQSVFAFNHDDLQRVESLHAEDVSALLYSAAMGKVGRRILQTEKRLRSRQDELFKPRASKPQLNALLKRLENQADKVEEAGRRVETYDPLRRRKEAEQNELQKLRAKRSAYQKRVAKLNKRLKELRESKRLRHESERVYQEEEDVRRKLKAALEQLGEGWDVQTICNLDLSIAAQDASVQLLRRKEALAGDLEQLHGQKREQQQQIEYWQRKKEREEERKSTYEERTTGEESSRHHRPLQQHDRQHQQHQQHQDHQDQQHQDQQKPLQQDRGSSNRKSKHRLAWSLMAMLIIPGLLWVSGQEAAAIVALFACALLSYQQYVLRLDRREPADDAYREQYEQERAERFSVWQERLEECRERIRECEEEGDEAYRRLRLLEESASKKQEETEEVHRAWRKQARLMKVPENISLSGLSTVLHTLQGVKKDAQRAAELREQYIRLAAKSEWLKQGGQADRADDNKGTERTGQYVRTEESGWTVEQEIQSITEQVGAIEEDLQKIDEQIEQRAAAVGRLEAQMEALASESSYARERQHFEEQRAKFQHLARKWAVHRLAEQMSHKVRKMYEEERQPSVLLRASALMNNITAGRYVKVIAPFGERKLLLVDGTGRRLTPEQLSRGTLEQLYLSMRFALAQAHSSHTTLPVMMDDVFVHFDEQRLRQALVGVRELSASNQVILFTCHEHVLQAAEQAFEPDEWNLLTLAGGVPVQN